MPERIEDYALLGDLQTAALVGRSGSVDWLPFPRFDSSSCFGALLGGREHGRWLIAPAGASPATDRCYRDDTLILESEWQTSDGRVRVIDFMPPRETTPDIVRIVEGLDGSVQMRTELVIRLDYGSVIPWVRRLAAQTLLPTGGIVAAPTTSLPERIGGVRNWDYRYCWLRDATFTLYAMMNAGYVTEARAWRDWLLRSVAGDPDNAQILYGVGGQRRISEFELDWLPGYAGSRPVRIGNAAHEQFQLDVYGEVMDALHQARVRGLDPDDHAWSLQRTLMDFLEGAWDRPDEGIWEVRGPRRHFTHSKVLAWVAFDRAVQGVERFGLRGPVDRWRRVRHDIHEEVLREGFNVELNSFTQSYGSEELDASTLLIPILGFLPADDPRVVGTVDAVMRELMRDGFVERYRVKQQND